MKFIFEVEIKKGCTEQQFVEAWQQGSAIIQRQPGAQGTLLHRFIGSPSKLLAIASWESLEHRNAAMERLSSDAQIRPFLTLHEQFGDVRIIGEFEEPQWRVLPAQL